ncbi:hypothetical protein V8E51_009944 [Hyaloscypha variabilis]
MTTPQEFVTLASVIEGVGVSAYLGAAADITSKAYLTAAGSILVTEALHQSAARGAVGEIPMANVFGTPMGLNAVYTIASGFITACPSSNVALPSVQLRHKTVGSVLWSQLASTAYLLAMEDAIRPDKQAFKAMYERHPTLPEHFDLDASFSNTILARGKSVWRTSHGSCDLPSFKQDFLNRHSTSAFSPWLLEDDNNHIAVLVLAWAYILSARWAAIIPGVSGPQYSHSQAEWNFHANSCEEAPNYHDSVAINLGDVDDDAARWWAAILSSERGWDLSISSDKGHILFTLSRCAKSQKLPPGYPAASFSATLAYLSSYCEFHNIFEKMHAALAATLLLPVAKFDNRKFQLPIPRVLRQNKASSKDIYNTPPWSNNLNQLDKLLTLSCNAVGTKAFLNSIFFEPDGECNICGAWLQGTFAFLDSDIIQSENSLLRVLMQRDPSLGFLWVEARLGWWKTDLNAAAWTGTLMSFIQQPVSTLLPETQAILRADECRLMYLSHDLFYTVPPLFPFAPFGSTSLTDTNIDVRLHANCGTSHCLEYEGLRSPLESNVAVNYDSLDNEDDDCSEMVTRNIFTWLRDEDGFPVAERAIYEHEWIDNLDSDDDEPITGETRSIVGGNLRGWLLKTMTKRSNSL